MEEMIKVGAYFGYGKSRRNPSASPYILSTKNQSDIIDLEKTSVMLKDAKEFVQNLASQGKQILLVGTKPEAQKIIKETAAKIDAPFVTERWIGGILTNFSEIKKRLARLAELKEQKSKGELEKYTKKERLLIDKEMATLEKMFSGIAEIKKTPDALFVIDPRKEKNAVAEARIAKVPVVSLLNSDCNIKDVDYPIIANDAARASIALFAEQIADAYKAGQQASPEKKQ